MHRYIKYTLFENSQRRELFPINLGNFFSDSQHNFEVIFLKFLEGISVATGTRVLEFQWCLPCVSKPG